MTEIAVWEDTLKNITFDELAKLAAQVPKELTEVSVGKSGDVLRDAGLLLTMHQIVDLKIYVSSALSLPHDLATVRKYLRFGDAEGGGRGLKDTDFERTFTLIRKHAGKWLPLYENIQLTATDLNSFAETMVMISSMMEGMALRVKAMKLLEQHHVDTPQELERLKLELGGWLPSLVLEASTLVEFKYYVGVISQQISSHRAHVVMIKAALDSFSDELARVVIPEIELRVSLIDTNDLSGVIQEIKAGIDNRQALIESRQRDYKAAVDSAINSAALWIFGLGVAIYRSVEVGEIRKELYELSRQQKKAIETLAAKNKTLASLSCVRHDLIALRLVSIDAEAATRNVQYIWNVLHRYINHSAEEVGRIPDALSLRRFMTHFRLVAASWETIGVDSDALIKVFRDAQSEYMRKYYNLDKWLLK